jgi:predicted O-methyltransferase YrrM
LDVDDYPELEDVFRRNLAIGGETDRVEIIKGYSQIALRHLPLGSFDIIYIDGSHAAADVLEDAILSWRLLKEEGVLIFDDYAWDVERPVMDKPMIAVNTFVQFFGGQMDLVHCGYQLVVRKRAPDSGMARED